LLLSGALAGFVSNLELLSSGVGRLFRIFIAPFVLLGVGKLRGKISVLGLFIFVFLLLLYFIFDFFFLDSFFVVFNWFKFFFLIAWNIFF
jgi:hypothetical protein